MRTGLHTMQIASANNVHRTPEVDHFAFQLRVHLVQVPMPEAEPAHSANPPPDIACGQGTEPVPSQQYRVMTDVDPALA